MNWCKESFITAGFGFIGQMEMEAWPLPFIYFRQSYQGKFQSEFARYYY
jgi:hypothetical protein